MDYRVIPIEDDDLPPLQNWTFLVLPDGVLALCIKRSRMSRPEVWERAWTAYRYIAEEGLDAPTPAVA